MSKGKHWVTEPDQEIDLNYITNYNDSTKKGFQYRTPQTVISVLKTTVKKFGNQKAMGAKTNNNEV